MTWASPQLMAWIQRIEAKAPRASLFELLELGTTADSAAITGAFHRIAGGAHPDLHRHTLSPVDAERLLSAYGKIAAAYDTLRDPRTRDRYRKELADRGKSLEPPPVIGGSQAMPIQRPVPAAAALAGRTGAASLGPSYGDELLGRTITPGRITQPPPRGGSPSSPPDLGRTTPRAPTSPTPGRGTPAIATPPSSTIPPATSRTTAPSMPAVSRTATPTTPAVSRTATPTTPAVSRTTTPTTPAVSRTATPSTPVPAVARTTTPSTPAASRTTTPSRITASPSRTTAPRTAVAPPARAITDTRTPLITPPATSSRPTTSPPAAASASASSTRPPATTTPSAAVLRGRADSRQPTAGVAPRGQAYFRKAQGCLAQGDLGGALFNLRLAAAADPASALIRVALAEVEGEMTGRK